MTSKPREIILLVAIALTSVWINAAHAETADSKAKGTCNESKIENLICRDQVNIIEYANQRLKFRRYYQEGSCDDCFASSVGDGGASTLDSKDPRRICSEAWQKFYSKDVIDLRIVFGYEDFYDASVSGDFLRRRKMVEKVTSQCAADNLSRACGFRQVIDDADLFEKEVVGPDGRMHLMRLRLTASSYSASNRVNRKNPLSQAQSSQRAKDVFYNGLSEADFLLYVGHARDGGGPDFDPAVLGKDNKPDLAFYRKTTPGLNALTRAFSEANAKAALGLGNLPKIIGFLACDSERWSASIKKMAPESGVVLSATKTIPVEVAVTQAYMILDSVLWQRCEDAFDGAMKELSEYSDQNGKRLSIIPISLKNFFK